MRLTIPHDARLPAPPSARTPATLRDDPLEPVAIYHHRARPRPEAESTGCVRLAGIALASTLGLGLVVLLFGPAGFIRVPALVAFGISRVERSPTVDLDAPRRLVDLPRPLPLPTPSGRPVRPLGPMHTADQAVIDLKRPEGPPGGGFDPSDRPHRDLADLIHTCRARDGPGFAGPPIAHEPGALIASIEPFGASGATLEERLHQRARVAGYVEAHPNPRAVWLAAVASREADDLRCLGVWGGDPWVGELARRGQRTLKARVGADALGDAGGLALGADQGASGGLSPADDGGLG